jgi:hypothetical protein
MFSHGEQYAHFFCTFYLDRIIHPIAGAEWGTATFRTVYSDANG